VDRSREAAGSGNAHSYRKQTLAAGRQIALWHQEHSCDGGKIVGSSLRTDGESLPGGLLLGETDSLLVLALDGTSLFRTDELNMAVRGQVRRDATVGTVGPAAARDGTLHANMGDLALFGVQHLNLDVRLEVFQHVDDIVARLLGEAAIVVVEVLAHGFAARASSVATEGHDSFMLEDVLQVCDRFQQVQAPARSGNIVYVLVVAPEIVNAALSRLSIVLRLS